MLSELFYPYDKGGAERRFIEVSKRLAKRNNVTVYSLRLKGHGCVENWDGVNIIRVGVSHPLDKRSLPQLMSYISPLVRCLQRKYDIVHVNQGMALFAGFLRKNRIIATFHDLYGHTWSGYYSFPLSTAGTFFERMWSKIKFDKIIANSGQTRKKLIDAGLSNIETIISGIDLDFIKSVKARKEKSVVYVGRLEAYKRVDVLIETMRQLHWPLKIIGYGSQITKLKKLAGDNVEFLGYVSEKRKIEEMKKASVLVNPSSIEGLGLVALESMACGTVPVVRDLECYKEFANEKNSFLLKEMTTDSLGDAITRAMRCRKASAGVKTAENFSWDKTAERVEKIYEEVLNNYEYRN
jgi:glycosyltransferase involved in cell wall biosynthesis